MVVVNVEESLQSVGSNSVLSRVSKSNNVSWLWMEWLLRCRMPYIMAAFHISKAGVVVIGERLGLGGSVVLAWSGIVCPPGNGKTFGNMEKHGATEGSLTLMKMRSGPGSSAAVPSAGTGSASLKGSEAEVGRWKVLLVTALEVVTLITCPLMSCMPIVTGQMISRALPIRLPARTFSFVTGLVAG